MEYVILFFSVINLLLGLIIILRPPYSKENLSFFIFAVLTSIWTFNNFYLRIEPDIFFLRLAYTLGLVVVTAGLFWSFYFLKLKVPRYFFLTFIPITLIGTVVTLGTNYVIDSLAEVTKFGYEGQLGKYFIIYSSYFSVIIFTIILNYLRKLFQTTDPARKTQIGVVLTGVIVFSIISFIVSILIPTAYGTLSFTVIDNLSFSFFLLVIFVATLRFRLFNLKIVATELFVFTLWIFILIKAILSNSSLDRILEGLLLLISVIIGLFLIRSVIREVEQREEIEKLATRLEKANVKLRQADKMKTKLMSIASHDLRSPLGAIKGYASMMTEGSFGKLSEGGKEAASKIFEVAERMNGIVEDFLNISRIEQGRLKYDFEEADLVKLAHERAKEQAPQAEEKGLELTFESSQPSFMVKMDVGKMEQIVNNLIDNAVKYTPEGSVHVSVEESGEDKVRLTVEDTGVGIPPEAKENLFKEFSRLEEGEKQNRGGTGLGLYIAKVMIEAHKGRIWAESEGEGKGSRFIIELPLI